MNQLLHPGQTIVTETSAARCTVGRFLGGGGQGEVYEAALDGGAPVAIKWFFPHYLRQDADLRQRLQAAIDAGPPSDRFLWPQELLRPSPADEDAHSASSGFGYVMPLREPRFVGITDLVMRRVEPSFRTLITAGFELAHSYRQLHAKGLCYRDISFGNLFFDPDSGEVRICDNDNVGIDRKAGGGIGGTIRFMAPEIVRGDAVPSIQTDLFSLAVLLFYMLVNHHPLDGAREAQIRCFDMPAMVRLYGEAPLFIFDPSNDDNRPLPGFHDNALALWPIYPGFLRSLFVKSFTEGIHDAAHGRVRESEWEAALVRLRDSLLYCVHCGAENFYDGSALRQSNGNPGTCWSCNSPHRLPPRMRVGRAVVLLNHDTALYPHHVDSGRKYDFTRPVAQVVQHPNNPQVWGLRNLSPSDWVSTTKDGAIHTVETGQTVTLASGTRIHFGQTEAEIRF